MCDEPGDPIGTGRARAGTCGYGARPYDRGVPPTPPFISYAQNREDVVLFRALGDVERGRYVEVGANHPVDDSVSWAFYQRGWSGLTVEPVPDFARLHRAQRPRDTLVEAAVTRDAPGEVTLHVVPGTGLSTVVDAVSDRHDGAGIAHVDVVVPSVRLEAALVDAGWTPEEDIHFLLVDVEGAEDEVLDTIDLTRWRPWVLVVESTAPNSTESTHESWERGVLDAGYELCLFDGLSRFYVAAERAEALRGRLSYPACVLDGYRTHALDQLLTERQTLRAQTAHWRTVALTHWADAVAQAPARGTDGELEQLREQVLAMQATLSWRVTRPLRGVRRVVDQVRGR